MMDENILNLKKGLDDDIRHLDESRLKYAHKLIIVGRHDEAESQLNRVEDQKSPLFIHTRKQLTQATINLKPSFIQGNLADQVLEIQNRVADNQHGGNDALKIFNINEERTLTGSSTYGTISLGKTLRDELGLRITTQAGLERARSRGDLDLSGFYVDTAFALRSEDGPNQYLAENLIEQIRQRIGEELKLPYMINLVDFYLVNDDKAPNGLRPVLEDNANIIYAPILNEEDSRFNSEDIDEVIGLPKPGSLRSDGERYFWTRESGLSGLCLDGGEYLGSGGEGLAYSGRDGRVVLQGGEATRAQD